MNVTGVSLFALCHNFGRRARAMMRSLSHQIACPVPIHVTIFYSRPQDAELIREGVSGPLEYELKQIPSDLIMRRGIHFSKAHKMHDLSHTAFFDVDLWFPPTFWVNFVGELSGRTPGYFSCRVMNIPWPAAEVQVDAWRKIDRKTLDPLVNKVRNDPFRGRAGSFQCIPRDLAVYPADPRPSVDQVDLTFSDLAIPRSETKVEDWRVGKSNVYHFDHPMVWSGTEGRQL